MKKTARVRTQSTFEGRSHRVVIWRIRERKRSGRRGKKEEEGKAQKSNMAEEMQRAHHKSVINGKKEGQKKLKKKAKRVKDAPKQGKFLVSLESGSFSRVDSA